MELQLLIEHDDEIEEKLNLYKKLKWILLKYIIYVFLKVS